MWAATLTFLIVGTVLIILYGKGYRLDFLGGKPTLSGTGLLVTTSEPDSAQVFINGHLTTATDNTLNLAPGEYTIRIYKEGYFPWEKKLTVQEEVVAKAEARLFPTAPKLESITAIGVQNPIIDPSHTKIAYTVASQSARKNGIYVLDMNSRPILTLQSASTQIVDETSAPFSDAQFSWSPDGQELIATLSAQPDNPTTYLLKANGFNQAPTDVTATLDAVQLAWETEKEEKEIARINALKPALRSFLRNHFNIIEWSPDDSKILYQASTSAQLPIIIKPRLVGVETTPEQRALEKGAIYVYDIKEDKNYRIDLNEVTIPQAQQDAEVPKKEAENTDTPLPFRWFPDSEHLILVKDKKIDILEFDGSNKTTVYAGPFVGNYVFPWVNGSRLVMLTNLGNPTIAPNLYTLGLE